MLDTKPNLEEFKVPVPVSFIRDSSISDEEFRIGLLLKSYEGELGCFPSRETLAKALDVSIETIDIRLRSLRRSGRISRRRTQKTNRYDLSKLFLGVVSSSDSGVVSSSDSESQFLTTITSTREHNEFNSSGPLALDSGLAPKTSENAGAELHSIDADKTAGLGIAPEGAGWDWAFDVAGTNSMEYPADDTRAKIEREVSESAFVRAVEIFLAQLAQGKTVRKPWGYIRSLARNPSKHRITPEDREAAQRIAQGDESEDSGLDPQVTADAIATADRIFAELQAERLRTQEVAGVQT